MLLASRRENCCYRMLKAWCPQWTVNSSSNSFACFLNSNLSNIRTIVYSYVFKRFRYCMHPRHFQLFLVLVHLFCYNCSKFPTVVSYVVIFSCYLLKPPHKSWNSVIDSKFFYYLIDLIHFDFRYLVWFCI